MSNEARPRTGAHYDAPLAVLVWGEYACFTRPEAKAERVSYLVPTPSAARGILEAIFWKPEFRYRVQEIQVLKPIRVASLLRNEITDKMPDPRRERPVPMDVAERRTQRHTLALLDVAYRIVADVVLRPDVTDDAAKFRDQFRRRVERGQCYHRPALGCREFAAHFGTSETAPPDVPRAPIHDSRDLGLTLFDIAFAGESDANVPLFFEARLEQGRLTVPPHLYETLASLSGPWTPRPKIATEQEAMT